MTQPSPQPTVPSLLDTVARLSTAVATLVIQRDEARSVAKQAVAANPSLEVLRTITESWGE